MFFFKEFFGFYFIFFASARTHSSVRADSSASAQTHGRVRADAPCFTLGNFKKDATVRPSHRRPRGHRPIVRLSENVRVTTLVLARRRQHQREFTSELADQEENSISANSPKLICTDSDDYSIEPPSKILCGNPDGGIKKVEVASPRGLFKTTMSPTRPMSSEALVDKVANEEQCKSPGKAVRNTDVDVRNHSMDHLP
jgi:hypothetical protein